MKFLKLNILAAAFIVIACCQVSSASKESAVVIKDIKTKPGIDFIEEDWDKALKMAKEKNKLIFLDIYATLCGPCKMLKRYTFTDSSVGDFFNKNFVGTDQIESLSLA